MEKENAKKQAVNAENVGGSAAEEKKTTIKESSAENLQNDANELSETSSKPQNSSGVHAENRGGAAQEE